MKNFTRKISSRKFLIATAGVLAGLVAFFQLDENMVAQISGAVVSIMSIISYVIAEGKVDAAAVVAKKEEEQKSEE